MKKGTERAIAFACGIAFIITIIILAIQFPSPSPFQQFVFRTVLAAAAAGFVGFLPGWIEINVNNVLRAGGAIAVFVFVYFFSPEIFTSRALPNGNETQVENAIRYRHVFGNRPHGEIIPPLHGADLEVGFLRDVSSGQTIESLFESGSLKIVVPFHIGANCEAHLFNAIVFSETIGQFLRRDPDIFIVNVVPEQPSERALTRFFSDWDLPDNVYFMQGNADELKKFSDVSHIFIRGNEDYLSTGRVDFTTMSIIWDTDGEPGWIVPDVVKDRGSSEEIFTSILFYLLEKRPSLIDRGRLSTASIVKGSFSWSGLALGEPKNQVGVALDRTLFSRRVQQNRVSSNENCPV